MSTFGTFSVGNSGGFGNVLPPKDEDSQGCEPRESHGDTGLGLKDISEGSDNTHWYDVRTGELYKDRVRGDGYAKDGSGKKTEPWPNPKSKFGDADEARAEGIDLWPFPPRAIGHPDPRLSKLNADYWWPGTKEKGARAMCGIFAYVNQNFINHDLIGKTTLPASRIHTEMIDCIIDCSKKHPKGEILSMPPPKGMPTDDDLTGGIRSPNSYHPPINWENYNLRKCKAYCMKELWNIDEDSEPDRFPPDSEFPNPHRPGSPVPGEESYWSAEGPKDKGPDTEFACPPFDEGEMVNGSKKGEGFGYFSRTRTPYTPERVNLPIQGHRFLAEITECDKKGMTIRTIESRYQHPGGMSCVYVLDKRGIITESYGKGCPPSFIRAMEEKKWFWTEIEGKMVFGRGGWTDLRIGGLRN